MLQDRLRQLRLSKNTTKDELAALLGITTRAYDRYETGDRTPSFNTIEKLSYFYRVELDYFKSDVDADAELRKLCVDKLDLIDLGISPGLAHNLIKVANQGLTAEEIPFFGNSDKINYARKTDVKKCLEALIRKLEDN